VIEKPYRIIYRVRPDQIDILAVMHGAQILPTEL
jgi:toxin ParE1/3/4